MNKFKIRVKVGQVYNDKISKNYYFVIKVKKGIAYHVNNNSDIPSMSFEGNESVSFLRQRCVLVDEML